MELTREQIQRLKKEIENNDIIVYQNNKINLKINKLKLSKKNNLISNEEFDLKYKELTNEYYLIENETGFDIETLKELTFKLKIKYKKYLNK